MRGATARCTVITGAPDGTRGEAGAEELQPMRRQVHVLSVTILAVDLLISALTVVATPGPTG